MPRHNRRRRDQERPASATVAHRVESWRGEDYLVRAVPGANAAKPYRCPGCDQLIPVGVPHLVSWPSTDSDAGARRHWHSPCWAARDRRGPGMLRSPSGPRY